MSLAKMGKDGTEVVVRDGKVVALHELGLLLPTLDNAANSVDGEEDRGCIFGEEPPSTFGPPPLGLPDADFEPTNRSVKCQSQCE